MPTASGRAATAGPGLFDALPIPLQHSSAGVSDAVAVAVAETVPEAAVLEPARVWTVGGLVREVCGFVEVRYPRVVVEGEVSNWRPAGSGHCYFTLKDSTAQLAVVLFRREATLLRFTPKDGDAVRLRGQVSVYESRGQMQLIAESMELAGIGAQLAAVQQLKATLKREGLFDNQRPLPPFPRCIGVVTSLQGAALRDIVKVCRRRHPAVNLLVYPAAVQGPRCAEEVAAGVRWFSRRPELVDVVLVARGGGSWEDLHGFDDERVARAIAACTLPVVVGVGHATDSTIADVAADVCAPTPSAAAELLTAAQYTVTERIHRLEGRARRAAGYDLLHAREKLSRLSAEAVLASTRDALRRRAQRVDDMEFRTQTALARLMSLHTERLARLDTRLQGQSASTQLAQIGRTVDLLRDRLERTAVAGIGRKRDSVERAWARADAMNPLRVLERGYALIYAPDGTLLRSSSAVAPGDEVTARLAEGSLRATVTGKP